MTTSTRETAQVIQQGKDDIEARYRSSLPNHGYVFPRRLSDTSSSDSSLERLERTEIYNLYTQNYHTSTTNTNASSSDKDTSEETEIENKQIEESRNTESVKKMGQMKVVSLGPIELLNLYRKTLESYREETEEEPRLTRGNRPESLVISDSNKKYGNLIMKIVKSKRGKEKSLQDLYGTKQKIVANVYAKDSKRTKHQKNVSKETSDFSQDLLNTLKGDMGDEILKGICVTEPVNPTAVPRKSVEKKCNGGAIIQQKTVVKEKEKHVKNKSSAKMINLHAGYQTTGTKQVVRAKTNIQAEALKKGDAQEVKAQEHGKCVKKVEIVKETGQIREVRDTGRGKNEEKTRETTREKTVEKPAEVKATLRKQVSVGSTQVTERLSTSRSNKPDMASLKRVETLKVNVNKKGNERESIDEKKERKKMVADALAVAKILDMAKTMPIVRLDREEKKNNVKMEEYQEIEVLEPCSSGVFDSPMMYKKMERRKMALNLHVVTQSVVKEYEAREKRREQTKKKMMEVRKFY